MKSVYHKDVLFKHDTLLNAFIKKLNIAFSRKNLKLSYHTKERLKERDFNLTELFHFFNNLIIKQNDIVEYTLINAYIKKVLIRKTLNNQKDIIFSINKNNCILTIYTNNRNDNHKTLKRSVYHG